MNELPRHARRKLQAWMLVGVIACVTGTTAFAGAREDFYRRAAERDVETFRWPQLHNRKLSTTTLSAGVKTADWRAHPYFSRRPPMTGFTAMLCLTHIRTAT